MIRRSSLTYRRPGRAKESDRGQRVRSEREGAVPRRGMLSVLSYGRLVARAVLGGLSQTDGRDYSLISASYGFGKDFRKGILKKGMCYGDDACFIARHRTADVLGKLDGIRSDRCSSDTPSGARVTFSRASLHVHWLTLRMKTRKPSKRGTIT